MLPLRRILGIVVIVLGIAVLGIGFTSLTAPTAVAPELTSHSLSYGTVTPSIYGGGSVMISWSGAASGTVVTLYSCPSNPSCSLSTLNVSQLDQIGSATGGSASFSASVNGGTTYVLLETGTAGGVSTTAQVTGITLSTILGIIIAVIGVVLVVLPVRQPATTEEAAPAEEENLGVTMPDMPAPVVEATPARGPTRAPTPVAPEVTEAPPASMGMSAAEEQSETSAAQANARGRPNLTCRHCGAINEPWITNCRRCKRPLSNTG
jgi:ribosomal protein L40E